MSANGLYHYAVVRGFLPPGAEMAWLPGAGYVPAIVAADLDGDRIPELSTVYRYQGEPYLLTLKRHGQSWHPAASVKGKGSGVVDFMAAPIVKAGQLSLVVGWQTGPRTAELELFHWNPHGFQRLLAEKVAYQHLEVEDMDGLRGRDGICEMAIWTLDREQAYRVETCRWNEYRLEPAPDAYPYYFPRVVGYYEVLSQAATESPLYHSYLEEARAKAGLSDLTKHREHRLEVVAAELEADASRMLSPSVLMTLLPAGAELVNLNGPPERPASPAVLFADWDGDRIPELAAAYRLGGELHVSIWKRNSDHTWRQAADFKGQGYGVTDFLAVPVNGPGENALLIGWQIGSNGSALDLIRWSPLDGYKRHLSSDTAYRKLEVEDMPSDNGHGKEGQAEIALWVHDTGEAYRIEVYRWNGSELAPAPDTYPYYFRRFVRYYEDLLEKTPDSRIYREYLEDARKKSGVALAARP